MSHIPWFEKYPEASGFLPTFFSQHDPRSAKEQANANYAHGGGWFPMDGLTLDMDREKLDHCRLMFPGDPPMRLIGFGVLREELILHFEHDWVCIIQPDMTFECARMN